MRVNKYNYIKVIQGNYGQGWEDVSEYNRSDVLGLKHDLKEYRFSGIGIYRVITRRELNK